jgi:asparagine synthase (glutamine-hydrolysing)
VPTRVWLREEKYYDIVKKKFMGKTAEKFFNTEALVGWLDEHFSGREDNSRRVWTVYVFLVWYDIYFDDENPEVKKPVNHLDELKALAEARREKQIDAPGEVIMAAAEAIGSETAAEPQQEAEAESGEPENTEDAAAPETQEEPSAPETQDENGSSDGYEYDERSFKDLTSGEPDQQEAPTGDSDENEPAIVEYDDEPVADAEAGEDYTEAYINISNPEDDEVYDAPRTPSSPREKMQMAIDSIEKRSKYLDEPNVISDEAIDDIVSQIRFYNEEEY